VTALPKRWLAAAGATLLAAALGVALLLANTATGACAAVPTAGTTHKGKATFYDMGGGTGNCSFPAVPADDLFVALGETEYAGAAACGSYLDVTGPKGTVRVKVVDSCPPCTPGHLDLSRTAFGRIADHVTGIVGVTWKAVRNPPVPGPLSVRFKDGANAWWFAVLIDNHANPLTSVAARSGNGGWRTAVRKDYNYWIIEGGAGPGPFDLKITDGYGRTGTATGVPLQPEQNQRTTLRFGAAASPSPSRSPSRSPSPSPSPSASPPSSPGAVVSATSAAPVALLAQDTACG
jgi:expansin (peptidoglycan-binding protein)